jgi:hypothetical protein
MWAIRRLGWWGWATAAIVALVACSASDGSTFDDDDDDDTTSSSGTGGVGGIFNTGGTNTGGSGAGSNCSEAAKLIYVLSDANDLYSFKPDEKILTLVGQLGCQTNMSPNSMAVDRNAVAWVNYVGDNGFSDTSGAIYKVSTADASCEPAPTVNLSNGWFRIGMGFSTDGVDTDAETLFVTSIGIGGSLGRVDMGTNAVVPVGNFTGQFANQSAELTGTGDGRLYAFFTSTPVEVAEINKSNAATISNVPLPTVEVPMAWAFSFWGGDFYLYTATLFNSRVNRYRPADSTVDPAYMPDVGFRIVGAGVSTCAPLTPPR